MSVPSLRAFSLRASGARASLLAAIAAIVCGCAALGAPSQKGYDEALQTWVGEPTSDLLSRWGQPTNRYLGPNNGLILQYTRTTGNQTDLQTTQQPNNTVQASGSPNAGAEAFRTLSAQSGLSVNQTHTCVTRFTADSGGIIRQVQFTGDGCYAVEQQSGHWAPSDQPLLSPRAAAAGG